MRQLEVRLLEFNGAALQGQLGDLAGKVFGDALLKLKAGQVGPQRLLFQIDRLTETAGGDIIAHDGIQLCKSVGQFGTVDHLVGDGSDQLPALGQVAGDVGLMHLGLGGGELQLQPNPENLFKLYLIENGFQILKAQVRQFANVICSNRGLVMGMAMS